MPNYVKESKQKQIQRAEMRAMSFYKKKIRKRLLFAAVCFLVIGILIGLFAVPAVKAQIPSTEDVKETQYVSVQIESGDTLNGIAEEYGQNSGMSRKAFVREIMGMNHMDNTFIKSGSYIIVPYY